MAPAWGPAGSIAFVRDGDVYVKAPGRRARPLTGGAADDRDPVVVARRPPDRLHAPARAASAAPKAKKGRKRKRPAPRVRELWVMRAERRARRGGSKQLPAGVSRPGVVARRAPDRVRDGPHGPPRALHDPQRPATACARSARGAADPRALDWQPRGGDPVIAAAGDIACDPGLTRFATGLGTRDACHMLQTSDLLMKMDLAAVLPLGDLQYEDGTLDKFQRSFDPTWGRLKAQMRPVVGNHEYRTAGADGLLRLLQRPRRLRRPGRPARQGLLLLRPRRLARGDAQLAVLAPAADNPYRTTARPARRRSSGCARTSPPTRPAARSRSGTTRCSARASSRRNDAVEPLFQALYDNGVDVLLTGHDHGYERFAPMDAAGNRDGARGVRQFVVGTGGKNKEPDLFPQPNSEVRENASFGVLKMTLRPGAYLWEFVRDGGDVHGRRRERLPLSRAATRRPRPAPRRCRARRARCVAAAAEQRGVELRALEEPVHVGLPGEADAAVELDRRRR